MSTGARRELYLAREQAERFRALFEGTFERWEIAGSVRRRQLMVGDVEHVVIPKIRTDVQKVGLWSTPLETPVNCVWELMDALVGAKRLEKAVYGQSPTTTGVPPLDDEDRAVMTREDERYWDSVTRNGGTIEGGALHRWGEKYRGVMFEGFRHEVFQADARNWGPILTIRTGPADFSRGMVSVLKGGGRFRQQDGYVRYATGPAAGDVRAVATEEEFFQLCNVPFLPADRREGMLPKAR